MSFDYPNIETETQIIAKESNCDGDLAKQLAQLAHHLRQLKEHDLEESVSTRLLIYAANLIKQGIDPLSACRAAIAESLSDDVEVVEALNLVIQAKLG